MRYETRQVRIGEHLGPIDWTHPMLTKYPEKSETLRRLEKEPRRWLATTDGGCPKFGYQEVIVVGMYDGWPYWCPTPSVLLNGSLGPEWHPFWAITDVIERGNSHNV